MKKLKSAHEKIRHTAVHSKHRFLFPIIWLFFSSTSAVVCIVLLLVTIQTNNSATILQNKFSIFASKPRVLGAASSSVEELNSHAAQVDGTFKKFKCPIYGYGDKFVEEAEKNAIPYWLVAAVAFQESSCGKNIPTKDGLSSNNLWGWGVYGTKVTTFESIDEGIETVSKYMHNKFYSKGITELCDIMKVYTPPSKGSWCEGVGFFRDQILSFETQ